MEVHYEKAKIGDDVHVVALLPSDVFSNVKAQTRVAEALRRRFKVSSVHFVDIGSGLPVYSTPPGSPPVDYGHFNRLLPRDRSSWPTCEIEL
ncbi:hypothetical protein FJY68_07770 [candidate division WOR-3 bacterium]|uniref:Uncharacterized protein n=1 Tax=candidate division WOR-3 bacterium TaxID=2052148 RepID=A0A937XDI9_UNCW3|nr:hypothetical protein [candidate division WOR-3 bacterium]